MCTHLIIAYPTPGNHTKTINSIIKKLDIDHMKEFLTKFTSCVISTLKLPFPTDSKADSALDTIGQTQAKTLKSFCSRLSRRYDWSTLSTL